MQKETFTKTSSTIVDANLRSYMQKVYNFMAGGLCITALSGWLVANTSLIRIFFNLTPEGVSLSGFGWLALFAPLLMVLAFSWIANKGTSKQLQTFFWGYAAIMGISLTPIFLLYTQSSLVRVFLITAGSFGGLSLYGYTTKRDLNAIGTFLHMGLIGLIIALIINIFLKSSGFDWALSIIGVGIFAGLTAYDTQKIRQLYYAARDEETLTKMALSGALSLYLDFVNLFLYLLRFLGDRR